MLIGKTLPQLRSEDKDYLLAILAQVIDINIVLYTSCASTET
jgi:hypothetical protein